ncbi:MAG: response regulator [Candidatus Zixiibacteriota bacterium]
MPEEEKIQKGSESILVVDDDGMQRQVVLKLLKKLGYNATAVESGEKALEFLQGNNCDLMLLDMIMPDGIDGTETLRRALEIEPGQRAIIVSGYAGSDRVEEAIELGAGGFLKKPLSLKTIALAVREELDRVSENARL